MSKYQGMYDVKVNTVRICVVLSICLLLIISYRTGLNHGVYPDHRQHCPDEKPEKLLELFDRAVNSCDLIIVVHTEETNLPPIPNSLTIPVSEISVMG